MDMLPEANSADQYREINFKDLAFADAARSILQESEGPTSFADDGSSPVVLIGDRVLKFFPLVFLDGFEIECQALTFLSAHSRKSPQLLASGVFEGWNYLVMSKLPGQSLKKIWPGLDDFQKGETCYQVGRELKSIHDLSVDSAHLPGLPWTEYLVQQVRGCLARHEKLGLRNDLLQQIPNFLESTNLGLIESSAFLHTEVMRDHVFFDQTEDQHLRLTGFLDFEPSMIGDRDYDFASDGLFLSSGDPRALRAFFEGYGNLEVAQTQAFRRRIMAFLLLHKYSNLKWYLEFMPSADSLEELADLRWAL